MEPLEFLQQASPLKAEPTEEDDGMKRAVFMQGKQVMTFMSTLCSLPGDEPKDDWDFMDRAKDLAIGDNDCDNLDECIDDANKMLFVMESLAWHFCCTVMGPEKPQFVIGLIPNQLLGEHAREFDVIRAMSYLAEPISSAMIRSYQVLHIERMPWAAQKMVLNGVMKRLQHTFKKMREPI